MLENVSKLVKLEMAVQAECKYVIQAHMFRQMKLSHYTAALQHKH